MCRASNKNQRLCMKLPINFPFCQTLTMFQNLLLLEQLFHIFKANFLVLSVFDVILLFLILSFVLEYEPNIFE